MINNIDKKAYLKEQLEFINKYPNEVGSKIYELEQEFQKYFGIEYASACSSGTSGLILSLKAIGIKSGDEVLLNCNYFISDPNSISMLGASPVFIDLGETINSLSLEDIKAKTTNKTKAIILIHLYGYPLKNTLEIIEFCRKKNIKVIEDCCQSIGAKIGNKFVGTFGDLGVFSFDTNKLVKAGEGGMIVGDKELVEKTRYYKNNCKVKGDFLEHGYNFRYNDFSAIYAKYSLKNLENTIKNRLIEKDKIENIYEGSDNIYPCYYNFLIKKQNTDNLINKDLYNLDLNLYKNYKIHLENFEII